MWMSNEIQAILFDIDGTLLDTTEFIFQAYEHTLQLYNLPVFPREKLSNVMGQSLESIYQRLAPQYTPELLCEVHRTFQEAHLDLSFPFEGVEEILRTLHKNKIKMAAITTRSRRTSAKTLEGAGIAHYFDVIISGEDVKKIKPDPEPLLLALRKLHVKPQNAVMIGDTDADILAGKNAGTHTIGVTYGFQGEKITQSNPDYVVRDLDGLQHILLLHDIQHRPHNDHSQTNP